MILIRLVALLVLVIAIAACSHEIALGNEPGEIKIDGSSTVFPLANKAAELFLEANPSIKIKVEKSGSGVGINRLIYDEINIASTSRELNSGEFVVAEQRGRQLFMNIVGKDAVVVIVNRQNPILDISNEKIRKIFFTGEISQWDGITDYSGPIRVYIADRERSGTSELFCSAIGNGSGYVKGARLVDQSADIAGMISDDVLGIGFVSMKYASGNKILSIDNVFPDDETILRGEYNLSRKLFMVTDGEPKGVVREFIQFVVSKNFQEIVKKEGYTPIR